MSDSEDESARADRLLAEEAEEEAQLELAMQLLRTQTVTEAPEPFKPTTKPAATAAAAPSSPSPPAAASSSAPAAESRDGETEGGALNSASTAAATSTVAAPAAASAAPPSKPSGLVAKKKKNFSAGGMDINSLVLLSSSDTDEEERERIAARKAKAAAALASATASKKAAAAAAAAEKQQQQQLSTPQRARAPSRSPVRGPSPARSLSATVGPNVRLSQPMVQKKGSHSRPVSGVSPSMLPPPPPSAHGHKSSSRGGDEDRHSHSHATSAAPQRSPRSVHHSSSANAALEERIRELEQHYHEQSYSHPQPSPSHPLRASSTPLSPGGGAHGEGRAAQNQLKLRILELEKDALSAQHEIEKLQRKVQQQSETLADRDRDALLQAEASRDRENRLRAELGSQVSELEQQRYKLEHEVSALKAAGLAKETSYREMVALGGKIPDAALADPAEVARIHAELRNADHLIAEMNRDNEKLHRELKIAEAKLKHQLAQNVEEQKSLRFEVQNKSAEAARLQAAQSSMLDPSARERIAELDNALAAEKERHHHEVASLKYELDKLRLVRVELSMRKEDATAQGRDSLRLTLESLQDKYNALKSAKETEVRELHAKLVWYIENQQLITTLEEELRARRKEVQQLQDENLMMNHLLPPGSRSEATGKEIKIKPRPQDSKRIKELEARVAELTDLLKKKSAASSSAAIAAAGAAAPLAGMIAAIKPSMEENELIRSLRAKVSELESSLSQRDADSVKQLRSLRQESDQLKLMFERRLAKLNKELEDTRKKVPLTGRNKLNRISELERSLDETRRFWTDKTRRLQTLVVRLRKGERVDERDLKEAEEEAAQEQNADKQQQQQQQQQSQQSKEEESKESAAPSNPHDSLPLPNGRSGSQAHNMSTDADFPRSPLRAQAQPHPHPSTGMHGGGDGGGMMAGQSSGDVLLLKQSLLESHARELHTLASKYESQVENMKTQWESQVQLLRATHDADAKLHASLLQQARDECVHIRQSLSVEMNQRSMLQDRCLQLESELQQAKNQGGYVDYHQLQHHLELVTIKFEQKIKQYEEAAAVTKDDIRVERSGWEEQVRQKNEQLAHARQRFQQLTTALKHMQQQQHMTMQQQQGVQQQQQYGQMAGGIHRQQSPQPAFLAHRLSLDQQQPGASSSAELEGVPSMSPHAANPSGLDDDDIAHLTSPQRALPPTRLPPPPVDEEAMQLQWSYLIGEQAAQQHQTMQAQQSQPNQPQQQQQQQHVQQPQQPQSLQSAPSPPQRQQRPANQSGRSVSSLNHDREPAVRQPANRQSAVTFTPRTKA